MIRNSFSFPGHLRHGRQIFFDVIYGIILYASSNSAAAYTLAYS